MKKIISLALAITALVVAHASAQLTPGSGFSISPYYTHTKSEDVISYDWDASGNLYYATATTSFNFGGLYRFNGTTTTQPVAANSHFPGASVVAIGNFIYFNDDGGSQQFIYSYGPTSGTPTATQLLATANYGLYAHNGDLFATAGPNFGTNHIYYSDLAGDGHLLNSPLLDLGVTSGGPGPLSFDMAGNLYYAPGFSDLSIYKWSAAEVAAAIASTGSPLIVSGHKWLDYGGLNLTSGGASSMLFDSDGDLLLTLTNFGDPSRLVEFGVNAGGAYDGTAATVLTSTANNRLGELRMHNGGLYVSSGNQIVQIVPEPTVFWLLLFAIAGSLLTRRFRSPQCRELIG